MRKLALRERFLRFMLATVQTAAAGASVVAGGNLLQPSLAAAAGTVTGTVFQDYNSNGVQDSAAGGAVDRGVAGVRVTVYDVAGGTATGTTGANGAYSVSPTGAGPFRVEFTELPAGFLPSARSQDSFGGQTATNAGTTVQFVNDGDTANVNLAINNPADYCQNNPTLATCNQWQGAFGGANAAQPVLRVFPYSAGAAVSTNTPAPYDVPATTLNVTMQTLGTTYGLAYNRISREVYVGAYFKRNAGFGPSGTGAIYRINPATGAVIGTLTVPGTGADPHNTADYLFYNDTSTFDLVSKASLGGMAISEDGSRLFVMNLTNRTLYALNPVNSTVLASQAVPLTGLADSSGTCASGDVRPFAVDMYRGNLYVGAVCSAQSTASAADLFAYVWRVDQTTLAFGAPIFTTALNYNRGYVDNPTEKPAEWLPWVATYPNAFPVNANVPGYPQPILSSIGFDTDGDMILGLRDRFGDQMGNQAPSNFPPSQTLLSAVTGGEILRVCATAFDASQNATAWSLESGGKCGADGAGLSPAIAPNGSVLYAQGPNGGEFYAGDGWYPSGDEHDEVSDGAVLQIPGYVDVVMTSFNPIPGNAGSNAYDSGIRWLNNASGNQVRGYRLVDGSAADGRTFAKANGVGELLALCDAAPIEIGNRIWEDFDRDGIQDPNEPGISGLTVNLINSSNATVGTAVTDANGEYYFVSSSAADANTGDNVGQVNGGVLPNSSYTIVVATPAGRIVSPQFASAGANSASIDSNAAAQGGNAVVAVTTGGPGANDHTFDIGFTTPTYALGNRTWFDRNNNGVQDPGEAGIQTTVRLFRVDVELGLIPVGVAQQTTAEGYFCFSDLPAGDYVVEADVPAGYASSTTNEADPNADIDQNDNGVTPGASTRSGTVILGPGLNSEPANEADRGPVGVGCNGVSLPDDRVNTTVDFGFYKLLLLGDYVWYDIDKDGLQDANELGVPGTTVNLYLDLNGDGNPDGAPIGTQVTGNDGLYLFTQLLPRNYLVEFIKPAGYDFTLQNQGANTAVDSNANVNTGRTATIPLFEDNLTIDAGIVCGALGNFVWIDANRNGRQDPGETPVPGVGVSIGMPNGTVMTTTTDATGNYLFNCLPAGTFFVTFTLPSGYGFTTPNATLDDVDSDANVVTGATGPVTLGPGQVDLTVDAGLVSDIQILKTSQVGAGGVKVNEDITYTIRITNLQNTPVAVTVTDTLQAELSYVAGSANIAPTQTGNTLVWKFNLPASGAQTITFRARVNRVPDTSTSISNTVCASMDANSTTTYCDSVTNNLTPTAVELTRFVAEPAAQGARVTWSTALEKESFGFNVWRSSTNNRDNAQQVNASLIPATGNVSGATYEVVDANATAGAYYWLEEIELSGNRRFYGPAQFAVAVVAPSQTQAQSQPAVQAVTVFGGVAAPAVAVEAQGAPALAVQNGQSVAQGNAQPVIAVVDAAANTAAAPAPAAEAVAPAAPVVNQSAAPVAAPDTAVAVESAEAAPVASGKTVSHQAVRQGAVAEVNGIAVGAQQSSRVLRGAADPAEIAQAYAAPAAQSQTGGLNVAGILFALAAFGAAGLTGAVMITRKRARR